ncbi:MAG: type 4b pilus protein PilO2 [Alphaproteobacteria bacterium]|nr:type 4b pilus protein PilO2 [Alphaproteobacteria bacterium]
MAEDQTEEKAWKSSFTEGGKTYAASLFWQPLLNEDNPLPEVKEAAENILEGADLYVARKGKSPQFGLAASTQGFARGVPSAAVALVSSLGNVTSFLGVFKVDSGWWYICFRNDVILSDGDTLFVNEKDAKDQFISMLAVPDWDMLFAPEEWGIDETRNDDLGELLSKGLQVKLDKISGSNDTIMLGVIIVGFAIILWFAYSSLKSMFFTPPRAPVIAPVQQIETPAYIPPEPKPWEKVYNPVDVMKKCYDATTKVVQLLAPGWRLEGVTCTPESGLVTSWRRELGRMTWMEQALRTSGVEFSSRVISKDGSTFMVSLPIGEISTLNSPPEYTTEELTNIINDLNQTLGTNITLTEKSWVSPRGTSYDIMGFSISSNNDPLNWIELLMKFSGLTINTVKYDINSHTWHYEGEIYELQSEK